MIMSEMYQEMKDVLKYFGLSFHEMDQVVVKIVTLDEVNYLCFTHGIRITYIELN